MSTPFEQRHIGISESDQVAMLSHIGVNSLEKLIEQTIPDSIHLKSKLDIPPALSEQELLKHMRQLASQNTVFRSYIGQGYYGTITPAVIRRNLFENPGWYTQYTPYQAEISQGRLEALLNFQTVVCDLTGFELANASLLDEATAAVEAMTLIHNQKSKKRDTAPKSFLVDQAVYPHTIDVLQTRAKAIGIELKVVALSELKFDNNSMGIILQYPNKYGEVCDYQALCQEAHDAGAYVAVAADLMSLVLLKAPAEWGADIAFGTTQRFGVPMGFGGPHAAYFATNEVFKRKIPGRIIGVSKDVHGNRSLRMALQTREQHIRRDRATSNICTAQALLASMAGMYVVYHGAAGLTKIASKIHKNTSIIAEAIGSKFSIKNASFFDTITIEIEPTQLEQIRNKAIEKKINFFYEQNQIRISLDETVCQEDIHDICQIFGVKPQSTPSGDIPKHLKRDTDFLTHPIFSSYNTETKMMRYLKRLENKDLSLVHSMIPLGSCTMKLNAAVEMEAVSWPEFANIHPFAPSEQTGGYLQLIKSLEKYLCKITGFAACSLMPNSGAQGEYAGLLAIANYHADRGEAHRNIVLIPSSAHGTNPASAVSAGLKVVIVQCDENGDIKVNDLHQKAETHKENLAALMVTYPSTHGVFEEAIVEICDTIHHYGGLVYMDGANMNAQVGYTNPATIHADVCHLNLHKTFAIPHGGGGPGVGPICVKENLAEYLPSHIYAADKQNRKTGAVSSAPFGSASILLISYAYIRLMGFDGLKKATVIAILNANYIKSRLEPYYEVLYTGKNGRVAHELIIDLREYKDYVSAEDVAKRLIDFGFHAPTLSFPVAGTLMIEPTESEDLTELDRFVDAMRIIRQEIEQIKQGMFPKDNNPLHHAPHTVAAMTVDQWEKPYSRKKAAFPASWIDRESKYWAPVGRVDNAYGDRNLVCTCPPLSSYENEYT